jgi:DNA repair exonuclease SbcCD ATPase subunit
MPNYTPAALAATLATALAIVVSGGAVAQSKSGSKILCWKDKAGKIVGCGDRIPPEYQDSATSELDKQGMTRKTTGTAEQEAKRAAEAEELAKQKAEEKRRLAEQKRKDMALLSTYASEKEIDQRRDRDLQEVDRILGQLQALHKSATDRHSDAKKRLEAAEKARKPSDALKDELARAEADKEKLEGSIAAREKEKEEISARYAQTRQRYLELRGGPQSAAAAPAAPSKK